MDVFNDKDFSDRILHVEIVADLESDSKYDSVGSDDDCDMDSKRNASNKKQKIEILEEKGDAANNSNSKCSIDVQVKTLYISSAILATKSPFFYKLFKNGMKESQESVVTLRINASEEDALMDLLNFMYNSTLYSVSTSALLGVLIIADKFEVSSCMSYCCEQLKDITMFHENALLYLELPSSVLACVEIQPLLNAAKKCVIEHYKDIIRSYRYRSEAMTLPLTAVEIVLGCDGLEVKSEEDVYEFILKWGCARYPNQNKRREILTKLVGRFLHFPSLSMSRLEQIRECPDFDSKEVSKLILNSLYLNAAAYGQRYHLTASASCHSIQRDYENLPIKAVHLESRCVVFLNLTKEKCWDLAGSGKGVSSQPFLLGGVSFALYVAPEADDDEYFGLFVERKRYDGDCAFEYEFAVMKEESKEFECRHTCDYCSLTSGRRVGSRKLFEVPCSDYFEGCNESEYVVDGVVRLRAEFAMV